MCKIDNDDLTYEEQKNVLGKHSQIKGKVLKLKGLNLHMKGLTML